MGGLVAAAAPGVKVFADGLKVNDFALALSLLDFFVSFFSSCLSVAFSFDSAVFLPVPLPVASTFVVGLAFDAPPSFAEDGSTLSAFFPVPVVSLTSFVVDAFSVLGSLFSDALASSFGSFSGVTMALGGPAAFPSLVLLLSVVVGAGVALPENPGGAFLLLPVSAFAAAAA